MKNKKKGSPKKLWKLDARVDSMIDLVKTMIEELKLMKDEKIYPDRSTDMNIRFEQMIFNNICEIIFFCQAKPGEYKMETVLKLVNGLFSDLNKVTDQVSDSLRYILDCHDKNTEYREIFNPYDFYDIDTHAIKNEVMAIKPELETFRQDKAYCEDWLGSYIKRFHYPHIYVQEAVHGYCASKIETGDVICNIPFQMWSKWEEAKKIIKSQEKPMKIGELSFDPDDFDSDLCPDKLLRTVHGGLYSVEKLLKKWIDEKSDRIEELGMTIYRIGKNNPLIDLIVEALNKDIRVKLYMEMSARGEAENDISTLAYIMSHVDSTKIKNLKLSLDYNGIKVHAKMIYLDIVDKTILKKDGEEDTEFLSKRTISVISTGNFNFDTSTVYKDYILVSCDPKVAKMVHLQFDTIFNSIQPIHCSISSVILGEIYKQIALGKHGRIWIQCNHLDNELIVKALKEAENRGCDVRLIVRTTKGFHKKTIKRCKTVVGDKLEHARVFIFGYSFIKAYISSSDLMYRNLYNRFESYISVDDIPSQNKLISDFTDLWKNGQRPKRKKEKN